MLQLRKGERKMKEGFKLFKKRIVKDKERTERVLNNFYTKQIKR